MSTTARKPACPALFRIWAEARRCLVALVMLALIGAALPGCSRESGSPRAPRGESVTVALPLALHSALVLLAVEKGYFAAQGLNVTLKPLASGAAAIDALARGEADVSLNSETAFVLAAIDRKNVRLLATLYRSRANTSIVARRDRGISTPQDLAGKRIGVIANTGADFFADLFLELQGIKSSRIQRVALAPREAESALLGGAVDAVALFHPYSSRLIARLGGEAVVFSDPAVYQMQFNLVARSEFTDSRPEAARRFVLALQSALSFLRDNPEEASRLTMAAAKEDPEQFARVWKMGDFMLDLNQSLLNALEDQARWAMARKARSPAAQPQFLQLIDARPLAAVRPFPVSILLP